MSNVAANPIRSVVGVTGAGVVVGVMIIQEVRP